MNDAENLELKTMQKSRWGMWYSFPARLLSLLLAIGFNGYLFIFPKTMGASIADVNHGLLTLILVGTSAGFIHGLGFVPRLLIWRLLFSPLTAWSFMSIGLVYIYLQT